MISIIAAVAKNGVIGKNNLMPWHVPEELKLFRALTAGKPLIIGRRTFESLPNLLENRFLIVLSRNPDFSTGTDTAHVVRSIPEALDIAQKVASPEFSHFAKFEAAASTRLRRTKRYVEGEAELLTKKLAKPTGAAAGESRALPGFAAASAEILIAGGESVYQQFLPKADRLYISHMNNTHEGDAFFPGVRYSEWTPIASTKYQHFSFVTYERAHARANRTT